MTIRDQLLTSPELFSDFVWAADQRLRESEALLLQGRFAGATYLLGLSAEMWLKLAVFRFRGATPGSPVQPFLVPIRNWMRNCAPTIEPEAFHSLRFWAETIIRLHALDGTQLPKAIVGRLRHHAAHRLFQDWKIDVRYRHVIISERHALRVHQDVLWIRNHWQRFGR